MLAQTRWAVSALPAWGDAGVICPWTIYEIYGDKRILERHLPAMTNWVEYLRITCTNLIRDKDRGNDYGDWLSIGADTPKDLIGTAFFAYATHLVATSCAALGRADEAGNMGNCFRTSRPPSTNNTLRPMAGSKVTPNAVMPWR